MARGTTLRRLATEGLIDYEDALVRVWQGGIDEIEDIDQQLTAAQTTQVRDTLGLPRVNEMRSVNYWLEVLEMDRGHFAEMLERELGVSLSASARNLPKGALARLRRRFSEAQAAHLSELENARSGKGGAREGGLAPVVWRCIGRAVEPQYLTVEDVLHVHEALTHEFATSDDPIDPPGARDYGLLESAVYRCQTSLGADRKYPTPEMASASLLYGITHDHPFHNGNKRTALVSMLSMLDKNGATLTCSQGDLFKFVLRFAQHRFSAQRGGPDPDRETLAAADWICENLRQVERGERPLKWRELKQRLRRYEVAWEHVNVGNRIKLTRQVTRRAGWFGRMRSEELTCPTHYGDDGREVRRSQLNQIRSQLQLTEEFGIDSAAFYAAETEIDDFIANYRKILYRLAKL